MSLENLATELDLIREAVLISRAYGRSPPIGLQGIGFEEVEERRRRRREWPTPVIDRVEEPREHQAPHLDRDQLARGEFPLDRRAGDERRPEPAFHGILNGRVAPQLQAN